MNEPRIPWAGDASDPTTHDPADGTIDSPVEQALRDHLHRQARSVHGPEGSPTAAEVRRDAVRHVATKHNRRVAAMSMSGAAAVALVVALVINAQAPQKLDTIDDFAGPAPLAGVATGSSTGSATGAAKGWTHHPRLAAPSEVLLPVTVAVDGVNDDALRSAWASGVDQADGRPAPELAVLADLAVGSPVRFVVASPQSAEHLSMGKGGRDVTIADRPARVIVANDAWHKIVWSMDDDTNVLVQSFGLGFDEVSQLLSSLEPDGSGGWTMDAGDSGLAAVDTTPPRAQEDLSLEWWKDDQQIEGVTTLKQSTGGDYEFWASLVGYGFTYSHQLRAIEVGLDDGTTATGVLSTGPDGSDSIGARLIVAHPSGAVFTVDHLYWHKEGAVEGLPLPDAPAELVAAAPALFTRLDDNGWKELLRKAVEADAARTRQELAEIGAVDAAGRPSDAADPSAPSASTTLPAGG